MSDGARAFDALVAERRLVVCVGPGGVGKTTTAAAIAARAAREGRSALVLTIDPAKRLADALGIGALVDEVRAVPEAALREAGIAAPLSAAMLDTKASFDGLVSRITDDEETRRRILENRVYQAMSRTMARSHAYIAVERVYDVMENGGFDLVVLDTPPMRSALDILDAPGKLVRFLDDRIITWFLPKRAGVKRGRAGSAAVKLLGLAVGRGLVDELVLFFDVISELRAELSMRADRTRAILREPTTAFVLVTSPEPASLEDATFMRDGLVDRSVHLDAVVFNRAYIPEPDDRALPVASMAHRDAAAEVERLGAEAPPDRARLVALVERLHAVRDAESAANARATAAFEAFARALDAETVRLRVPRLEADIRDLDGLLALLD